MRQYLCQLVALLCLAALFAPTQMAASTPTDQAETTAQCPFHQSMRLMPESAPAKTPACCEAQPQHDPILASATAQPLLYTVRPVLIAAPAMQPLPAAPLGEAALIRPPPRPPLTLRI